MPRTPVVKFRESKCTTVKEYLKAKISVRLNANPSVSLFPFPSSLHVIILLSARPQETTGRSRAEEPPTATPPNPLAIDPRFPPPFLWDSSDSLARRPWFSTLAPAHKADGLAPHAAPRNPRRSGRTPRQTVVPFLAPAPDRRGLRLRYVFWILSLLRLSFSVDYVMPAVELIAWLE